MDTSERPEVRSTDDMGQGFLVVHVTTARGAIPLEGALVNVRQDAPNEEGVRGDVIAALVTGNDGNTEPLTLPAPKRSQSLTPNNGAQKPYSTYHVEVQLEGYYTQNYANVPIFDGIAAIQPADLIPLPENGRTDSRPPNGDRFFESQSPDL